MLRRHLLVSSLALCSWVALAAVQSRAQLPSPALIDLQTAIVRGVGAQDNTLELKLSNNVLTALRVNSNWNKASHDARDNEASTLR
jgi:hypothetical protein